MCAIIIMSRCADNNLRLRVTVSIDKTHSLLYIKVMENQTPVYELAADKAKHLYFSYDEHNVTFPHYHDSMEIVICVKGEFHARISGEEKTIRAGEIAVSDSYDVHSYKSGENSAVYVNVISRQFLAEFRNSHGKMTFPKFIQPMHGADEIIEFVSRAHKNNVWRNPSITLGFATYLIGLIENSCACTRPREKHNSRCVQILSYIDEHFSESISLASISAHFGYAPNYFSALFGKYVGMSLHDYINSVRISKSQTINNGALKITEVAAQCGFESLNTYYRALKKFGSIVKSSGD